MKNRIINILLVLIMLVGVGLLAYPFISNVIHEQRQDKIITDSKEIVENMDTEEIEQMFADAREYNESIKNVVTVTDPFGKNAAGQVTDRYNRILNTDGKGLIGYLDIPRLNLKEAIYHGTTDDVLAKGIGHLPDTSFPIGGFGTHCVLSAHTGLPSAELFTNLPEVKEGDIYYIYVLNDMLAYRVDQIKVVEPDDISDLLVEQAEDYVTLVTCTPYGLNTHRLLVRGTRVSITEALLAEAEAQKSEGISEPQWRDSYGKALVLGVALGVLFFLVIILICKRRNRL